MKKFAVLTVCLALAGVAPVRAQTPSAPSQGNCFNTQVLNSSGATLRLATGQSYMVAMGADRTKVSVWQPLDKVTVCRGAGSSWQITNNNISPPQTITALNR